MLISMPTDNSTILGVVHFIFASRRGRLRLSRMRDSVPASNSNSPSLLDANFHLDDDSSGRDRPLSALSDFSRDPQLRLGHESSHPDRAHEQIGRATSARPSWIPSLSQRHRRPILLRRAGLVPGIPSLQVEGNRTLNSEFTQAFRLLNAKLAWRQSRIPIIIQCTSWGDLRCEP
jgi:hypothetical protein